MKRWGIRQKAEGQEARRARDARGGCLSAAGFCAVLCAVFAAITFSTAADAQTPSSIAFDGLLDGTTAETLSGPDYSIPASKGVQTGENLFFSYSRFGLETGESATFSGPGDVARIINRVTGNEASSIDGLLRSEIAGASVYLINPNGIVLGENAQLDLSGAFHATTADVLEFENGGEFHARFPERDSPLSMSPVRAFGFLSADPAGISVQGSRLTVGTFRTLLNGQIAAGAPLSLIGGDIEMGGGSDPNRRGYLYTGGERIDVASLDSPGRVRITNLDPGNPDSANDLVVTPLDGAALRYGDVRLHSGSALVAGGPPPETDLANTSANGSGDIRIRANDLTLEDASIRSETATQRAAGEIDIELSGNFVADGQGLNRTTGIGAGSGIVVARQDPSVEEAGTIRLLFPFSEGFAEVATIIDANGDPIRIEHRGRGPGGPITIEAENVSLLGGAKLSSSGIFGGEGGTITVTARDTVTLDGARQDGEPGGIFANALKGADSGSIVVNARRLAMNNRAGVFGEVSGVDANDETGRGGSITVDVDQLQIEGSSRIDTTTRGDGIGGTIEIDASEWTRLSGGTDAFSFSSVTTFALGEDSQGQAGTIRITTPDLRLADDAGISTSAEGRGRGGIIDLRADEIRLSESSITSVAVLGEAGNIYVNGGPLPSDGSLTIDKPEGVTAGRLLFLDQSEISTNANDGAGRGGDIVIDPEFVILRESNITAQAVAGQGGNIVIVADNVIRDFDSSINADSRFSTNGNVEISSSGQDLRGDLSTLPATIPNVVDLMRERCAARRSGASIASFVLREADGRPPAPMDLLSAPHTLEEGAHASDLPPFSIDLAHNPSPLHWAWSCRGSGD